MSDLMGRISHIVSLAQSFKVTEYKKAIKYLTELWEDHSEEDVQQITNYSEYLSSSGGSRKEGHYSWNDIFIVVHNLFESEINRIIKLKGTNSGALDKQKITKLLYSTSDKANCHLKPKTVINSTLSILNYDESHSFSEYYEVYLSILKKYVLQERSQRVLVPHSQWQELLEVCTAILQRKVEGIDYVGLLETVELVVRHGCSLADLLFRTKKLLPVIENIFDDYQLYKIKSTDVLFKLSFTVCQQIASDSRYLLCAFSESLPLSIIEFKGPEEKYELYLLFVQVHHPNGAILGDEESHACDEDKWKAILQLLYKMVLKDIKLTTLSKNHLALASEVFRQKILTKIPDNMTESNMFQESSYIQPRKKRRISDMESQDRVIDLVNDRDPERAWPIIQIAALLYKKYPDCLKFDECIEFLDSIIKLMSQSKDFFIMESLCELATVIAQNSEMHKKDDLKSYWDKIWDAVLRYLSMSHKHIVQKGCMLVQNLIYYKRISNPISILKLFTTESIQRSDNSIQTLEVFCQNNILPKDLPSSDIASELLTNNSLKLQLLRWNLNPFPKRLAHSLSIENFSRLLIGFTLKTWYKPNSQAPLSDCHNNEYYLDIEKNCYENMQSITIDEIEQCYSSLNSKTNLPFESSINSPIQTSNEKSIDNPFVSEDLDFLLNNLLQIVQTDGAEKELDVFITKTALIASVITDLKKMNMIQSTFDEFCLVKELKTCLSKIMIEIKTINWPKYFKRINYPLQITKALILLYRSKCDTLVNDIIVNSTSCEAVKKLYEIRQYDTSESTKIQECQINVMAALALYCCMDTENEITDFQVQIASTLLKLKKYDFHDLTHVISALTVLQEFSNIPNSMVTVVLMDVLMDFIQQMFEEWQRDDRVNRCLLQLLPKILDKVALVDDRDHIHNLFLICKHYHDKFTKGQFGQLTHLSIVECLNSIVNHKTFSYSLENGVLDDDIFITFVKSPYYLVRLKSLKYVYSIFSSKRIDHAWKETFFYKVKDFFENIFMIQRDLSADEIQEERLIRSISVIQILATVICSQSVFQSSALVALIRVIDEKGIKLSIVQRTLKTIDHCGLSCKKIIECNLVYILTNWCRDKAINAFPYGLLGCTGETEFYDTYAHLVIPVLIRQNKIEDSKEICLRLNARFQDLIEICCPSIIPWALSGEAPDVLNQLENNTGHFEKVKKISSLVRENLHQIIVETVQRLRDVNHFYATFQTTINLPERDPPHYKCNIVDQCFERLKEILCNEFQRGLFHFIITRQPSVVQKVLLGLTRNIHANSTTEHRAMALHQYVYFCSKISTDLRESYCDIVASYFVKDISFTLLHLAKGDDAFIVELACKYLLVFLKEQLPNRSAAIGQMLNFCVKSLSPLVCGSNKKSPARDIFELLLIDEKECLAGAIENLTSLPDCQPWNDWLHNKQEPDTQTLKENLQHFLKVSADQDCGMDSLLKLKRQLMVKKSQLEVLYEELESSQGFAEDCALSVLHNLIYRLIQLTKSKDTKIALEAAKCLGILGPADLYTMILHPQERTEKEVNKIEILANKLCQILVDLIMSDDIDTRAVSSDALYVLTEYECRENSETLQDLLYPFQSAHKLKILGKRIKLDLDHKVFYETFDKLNWWYKKSDEPYNNWITGLTSAIATCLNGYYSENLSPLFKRNVRCCEVALPRMIVIIIESDPELAQQICFCINSFFEYHFPKLQMKKAQDCTARDAICCILNLVNYMRIQTNEKISLKFEYLTIAIAAQYCSAYFSSILYTELWCRNKLKNPRDFDNVPIIEQIYESQQTHLDEYGKAAQDVLREAYIKIGDLDSIHGCGSSHLQKQGSKIPYYTNFQKFDKLTLSYDIECSVANVQPERGLITALRGLSLHFLAKRLLSDPSAQAESMEDLSYDCFWRLSDWNQITNSQKSLPKSETAQFSSFHYEALKCLHESDESSLIESLEKAHICVIKELSNISLESCKAVYPKLTQLQMLHEIEEFKSCDPENYRDLFKQWDGYKYICNNDLPYIEPILTQRTVLFKIHETVRDKFASAFVTTQYKIAQLARQEGNFNVASRALEMVSKEQNFDMVDISRLKYHEALLALKRNDEDMARYNLRSIINMEWMEPELLAQALRVYGNWVAENKSENPQAIISKYFEKAIAAYLEIPELSPENVRDQSKALEALAQFAHEQYLIICDYMKSSQFESLQECINYSRNMNNNKPSSKGDKDAEKALIITDRQSRIDSMEIENIKKDKAMYLALALKNYLLTLQSNDEHDFLIFRLVSLWLNTENMYDEEVNRILQGRLEHIPSYKFLPLVPQLAPHMSNVDDTFTFKISKLLERCAKEHPHHVLPVLLALKNLYNDSKYCNKKNITIEARVVGAKLLVDQLLSSSIKPIVQEMDKTSEALVMLAYHDADKKKASVPKCSIPKNGLINEIKNFKYSVVPTISLGVKKNGNYTDIVSIRRYESTYEHVGGINAPKKIICVGTDGILRPQLVKGRDDLRQDAVMQQVFTVMNSLLKSNKDAKQRNLHVRTYKVVPLTQRSGVLEWCNNTLPLSCILTGDGKPVGLHQKYYPKNYSPMECRKKMHAAKGKQLYNVFMDCCKNLSPAFHHFFTENYLSPEIWFERRSAYTKSVATTSIIGYVLGLGDRHVSNILIDKSTAEVIHIDFGIAFEQGKVLPTPETVPFRLTRDMEAGMGVTGVEGTMRRCCEETMTVLRKQREIIVTLLRVLLYDPLYSWAITPAKAATYQSEHSSRSIENKDSNSCPGVAETNKLAERALLRVQQKLQGIEEGVSSNIPGQVTRLIQQARDPANLCRLFAGWQAYL